MNDHVVSIDYSMEYIVKNFIFKENYYPIEFIKHGSDGIIWFLENNSLNTIFAQKQSCSAYHQFEKLLEDVTSAANISILNSRNKSIGRFTHVVRDVGLYKNFLVCRSEITREFRKWLPANIIVPMASKHGVTIMPWYKFEEVITDFSQKAHDIVIFGTKESDTLYSYRILNVAHRLMADARKRNDEVKIIYKESLKTPSTIFNELTKKIFLMGNSYNFKTPCEFRELTAIVGEIMN